MEVAIAKIDKFGRIIIPAKWRKDLFGDKEVIILLIKKNDSIELRPIPTKSLEDFFDSVDLGIDEIKDWKEFEKRFYGAKYDKVS